MSKKEKEVAKVEEPKSQAVAVPENINLLEQYAGAGMEEVTQQDVATPFLKILQSLSAQVKKARPEYVEGAQEGMLFNTVSKKLYNGLDGVLIIPCAYQRRYVEWKPNLGGFVTDHGTDPTAANNADKNSKGVPTTKEGNEIISYATFFVLIVEPDGTFEHAILSMTSTQFKHARNWLANIRQIMLPKSDGTGFFNPPMFYKAYRAKTQPESNDQNDWFGWKIVDEAETLKLPNGNVLFQAAIAFSKLVLEGGVKVAAPEEEVSSGNAVHDGAADDAF